MAGLKQTVLKGQRWQAKRVPTDFPILYTSFEDWRVLAPGDLVEIISDDLREFFETRDFPAGSTARVYYCVRLLGPNQKCDGLMHLRDFRNWSLELVKESTVRA